MFPFRRRGTSTSSAATTSGESAAGGEGDEEICSGSVLKINSKGVAKARFIEIVGDGLFHYSYKRGDASPQGTVDLMRASFVRAYDQGAACRVFELQDGLTDKVLVFECASHAAMQAWVDTIDVVIRRARVLRKGSGQQQDCASAGAACINVYEQEGLVQFAGFVKLELEPLYISHASFGGASTKKMSKKKKKQKKKEEVGEEKEEEKEKTEGEENESPVMACLTAAADLANYLEDVVADVQVHASPPGAKSLVDNAAKHALIATVCSEVNRVLGLLFAPVVDPAAPALQNPLLGDVHALITWITKYQRRLRAISNLYPPPPLPLPHSPAKPAPGSELFARLPALCELYVYGACGDAVAGTGAANNLLDYCLKIWTAVSSSPAESLQQHQGGSFHTQAPVDIWRILHQHVSLACLTESVLLHVLVAERVAAALNRLVGEMIAALEAYDAQPPGSPTAASADATTSSASASVTGTTESIQESETEFICAVANDVALHIENVLELVGGFSNSDIRRRIDEAFQSVVVNLVRCGQACLQRLVNLILQDTREEFAQIASVHPDWVLHGRPVGTIAATLRDYLSDLCIFLSPLWTDKLLALLFDATAARYVSSLLSLEAAPPAPSASPFALASGKRDAAAPPAGLEQRLSRVDQDSQQLLQLFVKYLPAPQARESLDIVREATRLLSLPAPELGPWCLERVAQHPLLAEALYRVAIACVRYRQAAAGASPGAGARAAAGAGADDKAALAILQAALGAVVAAKCPPAQAGAAGPVYSRLELRFNDLITPADKAVASSASAFARMQGLASASLSSLQSAITSRASLFLDRDRAMLEAGDRDSISPYESTSGKSTSAKNSSGSQIPPAPPSPSKLLLRHSLTPSSASANFVQEVLEALYISERREEGEGGEGDGGPRAAPPAAPRRNEAAVSMEATVLYRPLGDGLGVVLTSPPTPAAFQRRHAKLTTRRADADADSSAAAAPSTAKYIYTLFLYRKLGSSVLEGIDASRVRALRITCCPRALAFCLDEDALCVASSTNSELAVPVEWEEDEEGPDEAREGGLLAALGDLGSLLSSAMSPSATAKHGFGLAALLDAPPSLAEGHDPGSGERELRFGSVDLLVKWTNALAGIAGLSYDPSSRAWTHTARLERAERIAQARESLRQERQEAAALDMIRAAKVEARERSSSASSASSGGELRVRAGAVPPGKRSGVINIANPLVAAKLKWEEQEREREAEAEAERERARAQAAKAEKEAKRAARKGHGSSVRFAEGEASQSPPASPPRSKRRAAPKAPPLTEPAPRKEGASSWFTFSL